MTGIFSKPSEDVDLTHPDLKYFGEALLLLGFAYKLLRWVFRTKAEVEGVDPASFWSSLGEKLNPLSGLADLVDNINQLLGRGRYASQSVTVILNPTADPGRTGTSVGPESPPSTLLDILTPEQRKLVLEQLTKEDQRHS